MRNQKPKKTNKLESQNITKINLKIKRKKSQQKPENYTGKASAWQERCGGIK